jgi:outer membrane lipoprotein SlyB
MKKDKNHPLIKEAVGIFFEGDKLQAAINDLLSSGFEHKDLGLLAGEHTVRQMLGHLYTDTNRTLDDPGAPRVAFVRNESMGDALHAWLGSLFFAGATTAAGAAVVSAAVLGGALLSAATGAAAIGAIGAALALIIHQSDAEYLEQQVDEGHVLLFVRTPDVAREKKASEILSRHSAYDVRIYSVPDSGTRSFLKRL